MNAMTNDQLIVAAPAIFAQAPAHHLSARYGFMPTIEAIDAMRAEGWNPIQVSQKKSRRAEGIHTAKHVVRFRNPGLPQIKGRNGKDLIHPEIVVTNSHNGSSSWQVMAGLFRLICANGLIVADSTFEQIRVRHDIGALDLMRDATHRIADSVPELVCSVDKLVSKELTVDERRAFAMAALTIKFPTAAKAPIEADSLLAIRREEDNSRDMWTTFNVVQENLMRGGIEGRTASGRRHTTRSIRDINAQVNINRDLWSLALDMAA